MRTTRQRIAIKDAVCRLGCHPSADAVYEEVRKTIPGISLGTVYRNLRLLSDAGEIVALDGAGTACRYDGFVQDHYHFRCERCGHVIDVMAPVDPELDERVREAPGLMIRSHVIEFRGLCDACRNLGEGRADVEKDEAAIGAGPS